MKKSSVLFCVAMLLTLQLSNFTNLPNNTTSKENLKVDISKSQDVSNNREYIDWAYLVL